MVIWLDAPDEILLDRIRNRQQEHIVKTQPATIGYEFLDRYRAEYEFILSISDRPKDRSQGSAVRHWAATNTGYCESILV